MIYWLKSAAGPVVNRGKAAYRRFEKYAPIISFIAGFSWDNFTLGRIDRVLDNSILLFYVVLAGVLIVIQNLVNHGVLSKPFWLRYREWYPVIVQFLFGGLFSAYVVFYSQSAAFTKTDLFLAILIFLLLINEFLRERLDNLYLQMSLYFLVVFAFLTFFLPVVIKKIAVWVFLLGGFLSLGIVLGIIFGLHYFSALKSREQFQRVNSLILGLFVIFNAFYFLNWIPPVPLSLKYGSICHSVERLDGKYQITFEQPDWYQFWARFNPEFHYVEGDTVFCFASVFAPTELGTSIFHHWQKWDEKNRRLQTTDRMRYQITGGRDSGYRGYTFKKNIMPGEWRVDVETESGKTLSRMKFEAITVDSIHVDLVQITR
ncbi:MAG: DUF2914 domain-containing protein [Calditrichaeota bacterium]|nr:DUF2914 domain-containing protein [Calditrichota bacterium]